ncbi:BTAD domain-containing putative transcriptional regulator [Thermoactinospora rubra]|uniref:BTAD domain-containing putative transcriptional regulator n=1 Tax=Thermoactinospora rubra TaxID=1088767 RepID=UPI000A11B48C|nr:BTAD domain-containing putative transcriptional regulator [Thermoactinospora rubra]
MRFGVLGPLAVWTDAGEPVAIPGAKVRALLADLLVHEGRPVSADRLVEDLWGDEAPANPVAALQVRVSQLRKALEDAEPGGRDLVVSRPAGYLLQVPDDAVDARRFAELTARAQDTADPRARAALLSDALALWRGPAYADVADQQFAGPAVAHLEERRLAALEQRARARLELGEHVLLAGELADLVARHPLREGLRAAHMLALYRSGRQSDALASYAELRERLAEELGLDPGPDVTALHQAILRQDPALDAPPALAPTARRTNLPAPVSDLIGREGALAEVKAQLEANRLVTLTGTGGVGKTRLALEAARRLVDAHPDGVWLVELAPLDAQAEPAELAEAVLAALDIRQEAGPATAADRLADALRAMDLLLVLDNCEHVVEEAAALAEALLQAAPRLRVLATSREPLGLAGEVVWSVPPLEVPEGAGLAEVARAEAVKLFVARAGAATRSFALDETNAEAVARLCRRLDGIPLALELAATRVRALGVQGVVDRLGDRFRLLAMGARGAPRRQRTLTAVIDWSWQLLTPPEKAALRRLAVHADGCTLEAAEEVCAGGEVAAADVLDLLTRLVDRSLVVVAEGPAGVRYRLLESIAQYCLDRLADAGELEEVRQAHARHYLALAERAEPYLRGREQRRWLQRLDAEASNMRAALDAASPEEGLRLVNALAWYWFLRGRLAEARRSFDTALARAPGACRDRARAAAWRAGFALLRGEEADWEEALRGLDDPAARARAQWFVTLALTDVPSSRRLLSEAMATFRETGDRWGTAAALCRQAMYSYMQRDFEALERDGERSARLFRELGDGWGQLQATEWLAGLAEMRLEYDRAAELFTEALRLAEELGLWPEAVRRLCWLGWIATQTADHHRAVDYARRAARLAEQQGHREGRVFAGMVLGMAARRAGDVELAEPELRGLLAGVPRGPGAEPPPHLPVTLMELGFIAERRGDAKQARESHLEAFAAARRLGDPWSAAMAVDGLAGAAAAAGEHERAARLLGLAAESRADRRLSPADAAEIERVSAAVREALGEDAYKAAYEEGRRLKIDDAPDV